MIAFSYAKTDGAEYLSHLDLLRHLYRTLRRAGIKVALSGGFNPHPKIFMNNPLGTGIKSFAEYCAVDADFDGDFKEAFNLYSPDGVKCLKYMRVADNPNYAESITKCLYRARGINAFDADGILKRESIVITDKRGRETDIRPRIHTLAFKGGELFFTLGCGQNNLRPDLFCEFLCGEYGGCAEDIAKLEAYGGGVF